MNLILVFLTSKFSFKKSFRSKNNFRVFHGFGQAKFPDGGLVLARLEPIFNTAPATSKNTT